MNLVSKSFIAKKGLGVNTANPLTTCHIASNDAIIIPIGTSGERPSGIVGMFRYNTTTAMYEMFLGSDWDNVGLQDSHLKVYDSSNSLLFP